jgi:hypothetical protein
MKKLLFTCLFGMALALKTSAQNTPGDCPSITTFIQASCTSGSYQVIIHPSLSPVKPTTAQALAIKEDLEDRCSTPSGQYHINEPGFIDL